MIIQHTLDRRLTTPTHGTRGLHEQAQSTACMPDMVLVIIPENGANSSQHTYLEAFHLMESLFVVDFDSEYGLQHGSGSIYSSACAQDGRHVLPFEHIRTRVHQMSPCIGRQRWLLRCCHLG